MFCIQSQTAGDSLGPAFPVDSDSSGLYSMNIWLLEFS